MNKIFKCLISNKLVAIISILFATVGIIGIVNKLISNGFTIDTYYLIGIVIILLVFLRTIISDIHFVFIKQNNVYCDTGQYGTKYDLEHFITKNTYDLYIIGQNLRTILSDKKNIDSLKEYLDEDNRYLTLILTPYDVLKKVSPLGADDLELSITDLKNLENSLGKKINERLNIRFHKGTVTLSAMIKNPKEMNATLVLNPKWAYDRTPDNRLYCVIKKSENPKCFTAIWSGINSMLQSESISLEQMNEKINK